jgi:hypothetical protein
MKIKAICSEQYHFINKMDVIWYYSLASPVDFAYSCGIFQKTIRNSFTQEYGISLIRNGVDGAFCRLTELRAASLHYYLDEDDMNELGLQLLYVAAFKEHNDLALEVLKLNTLFFPSGFNTYDSYGEALVRLNKVKEAIIMYKKSLQLNPDSEGGKRALKDLLNK